jgi:hypothetical protein
VASASLHWYRRFRLRSGSRGAVKIEVILDFSSAFCSLFAYYSLGRGDVEVLAASRHFVICFPFFFLFGRAGRLCTTQQTRYFTHDIRPAARHGACVFSFYFGSGCQS